MVLPAPVGPTIATVWPALTSNDTSVDALPGIGECEADILEADMAGHPIQFAQAGRLLALRGFVLEAIESLELHARIEYLVGEGRNLVEPADQQGCEAGERHDVADPEFAASTRAARR